MDEVMVIEDGVYALSQKEEKKTPEYEGAGRTSLSEYVKKIFDSFKSARSPFEEVWQECWYNFTAKYQPNLDWKRKTEGRKGRSRIFNGSTRVKCHTAHSKIVDVMFSGRNVMPFDIEAIEPEMFGIPSEIAKKAAEGLKKRLKEHFKKIWIKKTMDVAILEMAIFGTAILKGPIIDVWKTPQVRVKTIGGMPVNQIDSSVDPYEVFYEDEIVPVLDRVSIWDYYVDVNASSSEDSIGEIHFKRMLPAQFRQLAYQGGYDGEAVREAARRVKTDDEDDKKWVQLGDNWTGAQGEKDERVSVLEYWGLVPVKMLADAGCGVPPDVDEEDSIEALVVLAADGLVVKACVNPLGRRPFNVCPYKEKPGQIYGTGVAEMMRDSQKMINSSCRMFVDNKALSGNGMVGINLDRINTKRTKDLDVYSGKTWYIKGNFSPREAIDSVTFPDVTMGLREMIELFIRFADEETALPKFTEGIQTPYLNKTMGGMSMLMGQANMNIKTVIENIDDYWIEPIVEAFGNWFVWSEGMMRIPLKFKATGVDSLVAKEIKMENYMRFMQITSNPQDAIFMDRVKLMKNIARILETDEIMRDDKEIKGIMDEMTRQATGQKDWREIVDIDRLYPLLLRSEQVQILAMLGIKPEMGGQGVGSQGMIGGVR